jgi:hypothetical protein
MIGHLLRQKWHELPISESHPKALLWLAKIASPTVHHGNVLLGAIPLLTAPPGLQAMEHQRDAAISALSAWAMIRRPWPGVLDADAAIGATKHDGGHG